MKKHYKVIVVGCGINGTGVARDLALRGIDTLLLDKGDISKGTSWASTGMIHGGVRYLLSDVFTTHKSCKDSGYIQKIAPHMIFRIPLIMVSLKNQGLNGRINLEGANALFALYDNFQPLKGGEPHVRLTAKEVRKLEPMVSDDVIGGVSTDEWGIDVPRLCVANAVDAVEHGADISTWTEITSIIKDNGRVTGLKYRDKVTGKSGEISSDIIINCTGPWSPAFAELAGVEVKLRPAKGVHLILDRRISNVGVVIEAIDGRQMFLIPHENLTFIGTTDDDYYGDLDDLRVTEDEIEYIMQAAENVLPEIRKARVIKAIAGVRPTLFERAKYEDDLTRDHKLVDHADQGADGFVTLAGGKLAAYRVMAEETVDLVCKKLGVKTPCSSQTTALPGGSSTPDVNALAEEFAVDPYMVSRLVSRQGDRAREILELIKQDRNLGIYICACEPVTEAEVRFVIRRENVRRAVDLISRCRIAEGPCQGYGCAVKAAMIFGEERGLDAEQVAKEAVVLLQDKWAWRRGILSGDQLAAEEMYRMLHQAILNPNRVMYNPKEVF